jgi:hypothetical protein
LGVEKQKDKATVNRKRLYKVAAIVVIVAVVLAFTAYYWQSTTDLVRITEFYETNEGQTTEQVIYGFTVKIANQGHNDVSNLILVVKVLGNGSELDRATRSLFILRSGQEVIPSAVYTAVNTTDTVGSTISYVATVESNGRVLDERTIAG